MEGENIQRHFALSGGGDQGAYLGAASIGRGGAAYFGLWIGAMNRAGRMPVVFQVALGRQELERDPAWLAEISFVGQVPVLDSILTILIAMLHN